MYQIGSQNKQPAPAETVAIAAAAAYPVVTQPSVETTDQRPLRKKPEVPDYLREPTKGRSRARAIAAAAVMAILAGGLYAGYESGKFDEFLSPDNEDKVADNSIAAPTVKPSTAAPAAPTSGVNLANGQSNQPPAAVPAAKPATGQVAGSPPAATPLATGPAATGPAATGPAATGPASNQLAGTAAPGAGDLKQPSSQPAMTPDRPATGVSTTASNAPEPPKPSRPAAMPAPGGVPAPGDAPKPAPAGLANETAPAPPMPEGLGRLISEREVLLRFDRQTQAWVRLTSRATVYPGDRLLSLPTYRSNLTMTVGVSLQLLGGTLIELLPPDARGVPGVRLLDGRAILLAFGKPGAQIMLWSGIRQGFVTFADPDSTLAVEVVRTRIDGGNPEKEPATIAVNLYSTAGTTSWSDEMHVQPQPLQAPSRMSFAAAIESPSFDRAKPEDFPAWIKTDERAAMEKRASVAVEEALEADRPISLGLKELAGDRRSEVSSLAVQCLAEIDEFESVTTALSDPGQRAAWNTLIESLRTAIARSPATAAKVRQAFEHHRGPEGDELYRMLWGYSPEQLQTGAAVQLVKYLDHDDLDFRELAFWNLTRIAGPSGHFYRPTDTTVKRQPALRAWKQKLDSGALFGKPLEK
jgi:hypothetical protein